MKIELNLDEGDLRMMEVTLRWAVKDAVEQTATAYFQTGIPGAIRPILAASIEGNAEIHHIFCEAVNEAMDSKSNIFGAEEAQVTELVKEFQAMKGMKA